MDFFRKFLSEVDLAERLKVRPVVDSKSSNEDSDGHFRAGKTPKEDHFESRAEIVLDSTNSNIYELSYTCLMIPRFGSHHLIGDVVKSVENWIKEICISYDGRLEFLIIKPQYLEWGISVSPTISPAHFVQLLSKHTSKRIFDEYPRFRKLNASNEFWAKGFFATAGLKPISESAIEEFIRSTRSRQGFQTD